MPASPVTLLFTCFNSLTGTYYYPQDDNIHPPSANFPTCHCGWSEARGPRSGRSNTQTHQTRWTCFVTIVRVELCIDVQISLLSLLFWNVLKLSHVWMSRLIWKNRSVPISGHNEVAHRVWHRRMCTAWGEKHDWDLCVSHHFNKTPSRRLPAAQQHLITTTYRLVAVKAGISCTLLQYLNVAWVSATADQYCKYLSDNCNNHFQMAGHRADWWPTWCWVSILFLFTQYSNWAFKWKASITAHCSLSSTASTGEFSQVLENFEASALSLPLESALLTASFHSDNLSRNLLRRFFKCMDDFPSQEGSCQCTAYSSERKWTGTLHEADCETQRRLQTFMSEQPLRMFRCGCRWKRWPARGSSGSGWGIGRTNPEKKRDQVGTQDAKRWLLRSGSVPRTWQIFDSSWAFLSVFGRLGAGTSAKPFFTELALLRQCADQHRQNMDRILCCSCVICII